MSLRICSYNVEQFNGLFVKGGNKLKTGSEDSDRLEAIANVIKKVDADIIGIIEAPNTLATGKESTATRLGVFSNQYNLRTNKALMGFISDGHQEIALMYDPDKVEVTHEPGGSEDPEKNPRFDLEFIYDTDGDRIKEVYSFYRPPLECEVRENKSGKTFRLMVVHTKSKGVFNSMDMVHLEKENLRNRRKLFAECTWIRRRVDEWLDQGHDVVVMGDINDGPGMDEYEFRFGRSAVELIMGDIFDPDRILRNYAGRPKWGTYGWSPSSMRFKDRFTETFVNVLIDHILVSQGLETIKDSHRIWNPYEDKVSEEFCEMFSAASDHFPVHIDIELSK